MKRQFLLSLATHAVIAALIFALIQPKTEIRIRPTLMVEVVRDTSPEPSSAQRHELPNRSAGKHPQALSTSHPAIDFRPGFMRSGDLAVSKPEPDPLGTTDSRQLLFSESKEKQIFDQLADRLNGHLEFPELLAEDGITGTATLDLYFDHYGEVDESRSVTSGSNKFIRGLVVKAARSALVEWLQADAQRLRQDQFRDQHFHADMTIVHSQLERKPDAMVKTSEGSYTLSRTYVSATACVLSGGVDLACLAMRAAGAIHRATSDKYKVELAALKDRLESYDELGLRGIGSEVRT